MDFEEQEEDIIEEDIIDNSYYPHDHDYELVNNEIRDRVINLIHNYRKVDNIFENITINSLLYPATTRIQKIKNSKIHFDLIQRFDPFVSDILSIISEYYQINCVDTIYLTITDYDIIMKNLIYS